jgi:uncharacterized phage-associated protein
MNFRFNFEKTLQAAGVLLHLEEKRMSRLRLLKFLYIADRELLAEAAHPITGDVGCAMKYGPVLSRVYDLIKGTGPRAVEWDDYIHSDGYLVKLIKEPARGKLSKEEVEKLYEIVERYRGTHDDELSELTHAFPEWKQHYVADDSGGCRIPWEDMLRAQDRDDMIEPAAEEEKARQYLDDLFGA